MYELPKKYLSYSQIRLWLDNKDDYREKYYENKWGPSNRYMDFGKNIALGLENKTIVIPGLIQYARQEEPVELDIGGVIVKGFIDQFDPTRNKLREIKTGIYKPDGKPRWTQELVDKHLQLDIYSLCIELKYGAVDDECHLDWLVTRNKPKEIEFDGHTLGGDNLGELELTGELHSFPRVITHDERERTKLYLLSLASEIASDYRDWKASRA